MALIEINSGDNSFHRLIDWCVVENDVGRFAAKLECQLFLCPGDSRRDSFPNFGRTGERDLVDIGMIDECAAGFASASHDVNHAIGQFHFLQNLGEMKSSDGSSLGRLQDTGVSASQRWSQLPSRPPPPEN